MRIDRDVPFDRRDHLAGFMAFCPARALHALRAYDQERAASAAPSFPARRANLIFERPLRSRYSAAAERLVQVNFSRYRLLARTLPKW